MTIPPQSPEFFYCIVIFGIIGRFYYIISIFLELSSVFFVSCCAWRISSWLFWRFQLFIFDLRDLLCAFNDAPLPRVQACFVSSSDQTRDGNGKRTGEIFPLLHPNKNPARRRKGGGLASFSGGTWRSACPRRAGGFCLIS